MNLLQHETSPYLLQHKDNPVHWMPWGTEALTKAKEENKPILLSVGYSACHWCHVMAHESFEDSATAALMNQHFINIKVDREERPDIDTLYQNALALMGKQGGWPLTMFLTPDGHPFWGGTYFPPQPRYGMPSFREILRGLTEAYVQDKDKIEHNVKSLTVALEKMNASRPGTILSRDALDKVGDYFLGLIDPAHGGIGHAPKFPNLPIINFLWSTYIRTGMDSYKAAVIHSLTQMCQGGLYDHVGGGFSRYTVDAEWLVPHFEKMLYDNAQFVALLTEVYKETQNPLFAARITETIEWVQRHLGITNDGLTAFAAALDADSEGEEGKYYVWTMDDVEKALGKDAEAFSKVYDVTRFGNWENKTILNRLQKPEYGTEAEEQRWQKHLHTLRSVRDKRVPPARDHKILADVNALMIAALAKAGEALVKPSWIKSAQDAFSFIVTYMSDGDQLYHSCCEGQARHAALLEDYANMAEAALTLYQVTQDKSYIDRAVQWVSILDQDYWDARDGGYFMSAQYVTDVLVRTKSAHDSAVPSGNGTMVGVLAKLYQLTGRETYANKARKTAETFSGEVAQHFFPFATLLNNSDALIHPLTAVIVTNTAEKSQEMFQDVFKMVSAPNLVRFFSSPDIVVAASHPAFGKTLVNGKTTAYLCSGTECLTPVTDAEAFEELIKKERSRKWLFAANDS